MAVVEILESCMVKPISSNATLPPPPTPPMHVIWLSNLDLLVARSHTPTVYVYHRPSPADDDDPAADFFSPDVLKSALSKALVLFYPLAGRLAQDAGTGRPEIHCTGDGALFVTARADATLHDLAGDCGFAPSDELRKMLVPSAADADDDRAGILAMFQVTSFKCGGVCVGAAIHHTAADGLAALDFVNTWAAIARRSKSKQDVVVDHDEAAPRPWVDRTLLRARSPPDVRFDHTAEYSHRRSASADNDSKTTPTKVPFDSAILPMSMAQVDLLKGNGSNGKKQVSTFKAVVAHVWRCACLARKLAADSDTRLYMTADARSRVRPPLPSGYLGNAIFRASAVAKSGAVVSEPLDAVAARVSNAAARLDDAYVRSLLDCLEEKVVGDVAGMRKGEWVMPETDLWVISWQGLPIYDADFGWGRPAFMGRACLQFSGLVYLVPGPDGDGRLDVVVAMEPERLARFKELLYEIKGEEGVPCNCMAD